MNNEDRIENKHEVRVHVNRKPFESPNPTIGAALYRLGEVLADQELFREVEGELEDEPIPNDQTEVRLKQDEHLYSEKEYTIVVNGRQKVVTVKELSFDEVVGLAFDSPPSGPNIKFTITYRKGPRKKSEGTLIEGGIIKIKEGMIFSVTSTNRS